MREREEEIRNIHKGMHTVNEIYKDLAHLVDNQQEGVDQIENQMEGAKDNTASGLKHIEKANEASTSQCVISWEFWICYIGLEKGERGGTAGD